MASHTSTGRASAGGLVAMGVVTGPEELLVRPKGGGAGRVVGRWRG